MEILTELSWARSLLTFHFWFVTMWLDSALAEDFHAVIISSSTYLKGRDLSKIGRDYLYNVQMHLLKLPSNQRYVN
jgi:hypothetical protein